MEDPNYCIEYHAVHYKTHDGRDAAAPARKVCVECLRPYIEAVKKRCGADVTVENLIYDIERGLP